MIAIDSEVAVPGIRVLAAQRQTSTELGFHYPFKKRLPVPPYGTAFEGTAQRGPCNE